MANAEVKSERVSIVVYCPRGSRLSPESMQRIARGAKKVEPGRLSFELLLAVAESDRDAYRDSADAIDIDVRVVTWRASATRGEAMTEGFRAAAGDLVLLQDAQLAYSPTDYPSLLAPILAGEADAVLGSRFTGHGPTRVLHYWHSLRNRRLTTLSNMVTNLNLTDIEACQRAFRREIVAGLDLHEDGLAAEVELVAKVARDPEVRIFEVGIGYAAEASEDEKRLSLRDTFRAASSVFRYGLGGNVD